MKNVIFLSSQFLLGEAIVITRLGGKKKKKKKLATPLAVLSQKDSSSSTYLSIFAYRQRNVSSR
jgi:hypothetical protein